MSYIIKSLVEAVGPIRPDANVSWGIGQTREVDDSQIEFYRANPAAFTILSGPGYSENSVAGGIVGEIRYFPSAPGAGWLKCDGAPYLRTAYPDYEGMRPLGAFQLSEIVQASGVGMLSEVACWTGQYYVIAQSGSRNLWRSTDLVNWTSLPNAIPVGVDGYINRIIAIGATGVVIYFCGSTGLSVVSNDHGATWSTSTPVSLPVETLSIPGGKVWSYPILRSDGKIITFKKCTNVAAVTSDGITWTTITITAAGAWHCIYDAAPGDSDVYALDAHRPGLLIEVYGDSFWYYYDALPVTSEYSDVRGGCHASNGSFTVNICSRGAEVVIADVNYNVKVVRYDLPVERDYIGGGGGAIGNRFVFGTGTDLIVVNADSASVDCVLNFFPSDKVDNLLYTRTISHASGVYFFGKLGLFNVTLDPLKFNAPGLPDKAGASPYVYTGA